jgi:hypothetical protein
LDEVIGQVREGMSGKRDGYGREEDGHGIGSVDEVKSTFDLSFGFRYSSRMCRALKIDYEGAWYHVVNRGRRSDRVFEGGKDYLLFIESMKDATGVSDPRQAGLFVEGFSRRAGPRGARRIVCRDSKERSR